MPEVSVIIPAYNAGRFIGEALESVLRQTFQDFEVIVVDDGSTDNTAEVVARFADLRIRYVRQENRGLAAARNRGLQLAQGDFIAFLDADDLWEPGFLAHCVTRLRKAPQRLAAVYTWATYCDAHGRPLPQGFRACLSGAALRKRLRECNLFPIHAVVARTKAVQEVGGFDESLRCYEDWDLWLRFVQRYDIGCLPECLAYYRVIEGSLSTDPDRVATNQLALLRKHLGPLEGTSRSWPVEKRRAYSLALRQSAVIAFQKGSEQRGWNYLINAVHIWPMLLEQVDTHYELLCWDQPRGWRGDAHLLAPHLELNAARVHLWLEHLFQTEKVSLWARWRVLGAMHLAQAMMYDQLGDWGVARRHLLKACLLNPVRSLSPVHIRRLVKLCLGHRIANVAKTVIACYGRKLELSRD